MKTISQTDRIRGKTILWTWTDGPTKGTTHQHVFNGDGSVDWNFMDGPQKGLATRENEYATVKIADDLYVVSYLASSGDALSVVLNFHDHKLTGFTSSAQEWFPCKGTFKVVQ